MPDFLTHVLVMYIGLAIASWRVGWLDRPYIVVGMAGGLIPDVVKITLLVPAAQVEAILGIPFAWAPLARLGGSLVTAAVASLLVTTAHRRRVFGLLVVGVGVHLALDGVLARPGPASYDMFYPLTYWAPPLPDVYLSSDVWPSITASILAVLTYVVGRARRRA